MAADNPFLLSPNKRPDHDPLELSVTVRCPRCKLAISGVVPDPTKQAVLEATIRGAAGELASHFCDPDAARRRKNPQRKPVKEEPEIEAPSPSSAETH